MLLPYQLTVKGDPEKIGGFAYMDVQTPYIRNMFENKQNLHTLAYNQFIAMKQSKANIWVVCLFCTTSLMGFPLLVMVVSSANSTVPSYKNREVIHKN